MRKLTKVQSALLAEIAEDGPQRIAPDYPPIRRLAADGMVAGDQGRWGSWTWFITPAGRAALAEQEKGDA